MILIRHGESEFNVVFSRARIDPGIRDPHLTDHGRQQALDAAEVLAGYDIARILTSPYTRALQTATIIADHLGLPVEVEPLVRERGFFTCDIGTPASELCKSWPDHRFDHLPEIWWQEDETEAALERRCADFRRIIVGHPDWPHLAVVGHWAFIRSLTGIRLGNGEIVTYDPANHAIGHLGA